MFGGVPRRKKYNDLNRSDFFSLLRTAEKKTPAEHGILLKTSSINSYWSDDKTHLEEEQIAASA
jgi:hypothetical protein